MTRYAALSAVLLLAGCIVGERPVDTRLSRSVNRALAAHAHDQIEQR